MTKELAIYEAEITNPETGEIVIFRGRMVDVGYFLGRIKNEIWQHEKEIKNALGSYTWRQVQENPGSPMTRHYEGDVGKVTVQVKQEPQFNQEDIDKIRALLTDEEFYKLFKPQTTYKPMIREIKRILHTTSDKQWHKQIKGILEEKMKYAETKFNLNYEKKEKNDG